MSLPKADDGRRRVVVFDLDGTLVDSAHGVMDSLSRAFERSGRAAPSADRSRWVGPPLADALAGAGVDGEDAARIHASFREDYDSRGVLTSTLFPGARELLEALRSSGAVVAIATSKPHGPTVALLEHLGVRELFDVVVGESAGREARGKPALIGEVLQRIEDTGVDVTTAVLVGDRYHDVRGAAEHGLPAIFVTWGYAAHPDEAAGAERTVTTFAELRSALIG